MAKVIRVIVECGVPDEVTEKRLVWKMRSILQYPLQLGHPGDQATLVKAEVKAFSRVLPYFKGPR
jgi:hypothetical protein